MNAALGDCYAVHRFDSYLSEVMSPETRVIWQALYINIIVVTEFCSTYVPTHSESRQLPVLTEPRCS